MKTNRRKFLKISFVSAAGISIASKNIAFDGASRIIGANDSINVAVIGVRGHGKTHIHAYKNEPNVNIVAPSIAQFPDWINNPSGRNSKRETFVTYNPEKADDPLQAS
jgi:hypothetical protein